MIIIVNINNNVTNIINHVNIDNFDINTNDIGIINN